MSFELFITTSYGLRLLLKIIRRYTDFKIKNMIINKKHPVIINTIKLNYTFQKFSWV